MRVAVQGSPIACEVRGEGRPILLVHGWSADHDSLSTQDQMLAIVRGLRLRFARRPGPEGFAGIPVNVVSAAGCARIGWILRRES